MNKMITAVLLLGMSASVGAQTMSVGLKAGTQGIGVDLSTPILPDTLNARLGASYLSYNRAYDSSNVHYDGTLKLKNLSALADYYPFHGSFRLTGGLSYNGNKFDVTAVPTGSQTYTINGNTYTAQNVGSMAGEVTWNKAAPYLGIGWGNPVGTHSGLTFMTDLGVMYQGPAKVSLAATGAAANPALANDVETARQQAQNDLSKYRWYPVLSLGLAYKF